MSRLCNDVDGCSNVEGPPINWDAWNVLHLSGLSLGTIVDFMVSACLFGVVSALAAISALLLFRKGVAQPSVRILLTATVVLYISTCVYFGYTLSLYWVQHKTTLDAASAILASDSPESLHDDLSWLSNITATQEGVMTAALTVNMLISDMIVWWRALAIWPRNRLVWGIGIILIVTTGVLGMVTTYQNFPQGYSAIPSYSVDNAVALVRPEAIAYDPIGMACAALSLATNVIATALIGYKTWTHRCTMKKYQVGGKTIRSRAMSVLMFLVESGVGYCLLWTLVVSYVGITLNSWNAWTTTEHNYVVFMNHFVFGGLVPVIAIYPMAIIVIVTVNQSPIDRLSTSLQSH